MREYNDYDDLLNDVDELLRDDDNSEDDSWVDDIDYFLNQPVRNAANDYGQEPVFRNAANGYGQEDARWQADEPEYDEEAAAMRYDPQTNSGSVIKAYNTDYASRAANRAKKKRGERPAVREGAGGRRASESMSPTQSGRSRQTRPTRSEHHAQAGMRQSEELLTDRRNLPQQRRRKQPSYDEERREPVGSKKPRGKKKRHVLLKLVLLLLLLIAVATGLLWIFAKPPEGTDMLGEKRDGCTSILLAGTDKDGTRTDTMMLLYMDEKNGEMNLLSLPRDTYTSCDTSVPKLNSIYGIAGCGKEGMERLLDYTRECIGYRPDGYVLIDLDCFEKLVNLMGGVTFDVPMDMQYDDPSQDLHIDLKAGEQKLNGKESMWVVRFRSGYAMADLQRVQVQRDFIKAAMEQWMSLKNVWKAPAAASLITANTTTNLSARELAWLAKTAKQIGTGNMQTATLPGEPNYVGSGSYYILYPNASAKLINESYNPYTRDVSPETIYSPFY